MMITPAVQQKIRLKTRGCKQVLVNGTRPLAEIKSGLFFGKTPLAAHIDKLAEFVSETVKNYSGVKTTPIHVLRVPEVWVNESGEFSVRFGVRGMAYEVYSLNLDNGNRATFGLPPLSDEARRGDGAHSI